MDMGKDICMLDIKELGVKERREERESCEKDMGWEDSGTYIQLAWSRRYVNKRTEAKAGKKDGWEKPLFQGLF